MAAARRLGKASTTRQAFVATLARQPPERTTMRPRAFAIALLAALPALPQEAAAQRSGTYAVEGRGADGTAYQGVVQFQATGPETWRLTWRIAGTTTQGIGIRIGDLLSVGYVAQGQTGVAVYEVNADGTLSGAWTQGREGGVGGERLLPR
jgi:hypothetical protein